MRTASPESTPRTHYASKMAAIAAMAAVTLAGCTDEPSSGAESPRTTFATAEAVPQMAGLAAMKLIFTANPGGNDQIFEQSLGVPSATVTPLTKASCNSNNPQPSPDGGHIVYYSDCAGGPNQVFMLDLKTHTQTQLTHDAAVQNYDPTFVVGPNNELAIDWKRSDTRGSYGELWEMDVDGSGQHNLTPGLIASKQEAWKPTGVSQAQRIFTMRGHQGDPVTDKLYSLNVSDGSIEQLTTGTVPDWFPSYSPQQHRVVFNTLQDGHDVLAIMNPDGTDRRLLVEMPGDSDDPSWSLDGNVVVFINNGAGDYSVYAQEVATGRRALLYNGNVHGRALAPILVPNR